MDKNRIAEIVLDLCNNILLAGKDDADMLPCLSAEEWSQVLGFASANGVLPVIAHLFSSLEVQDAKTRLVLVKWFMAAQGNRQRYRQRLATMRELSALFGAEGIDVMFMKGATLAQLYPDPEWRVFSDIDYYLFGQSEEGIRVMTRHGIVNSAYYHHHTQASLHGVLLENHYDFVERVNHRCDIILDDALKALAEKEGKTIPTTFLGEDIRNAYVMTPTMNAVFLMRHMSAHFVGETIPLRMLYDWALFLRRHAGEVDWDLVTGLYEKSGMVRFAGIVQQTLKDRLGMECAVCPQYPVESKMAARFWDSIIHPPRQDPYRKFSLRYYLFETTTFFANRWKHAVVYPGESYALLFCKYALLGVKKMLGLLKL